jgi:DNA mismatch repair protein MutL
VRHAVLAALEGSLAVAWSSQPQTSVLPRPSAASPAQALRAPDPLQSALNLGGTSAATTVEPPQRQREVLPMLRVVGQLNATYLVCEGPDGMYLLDQHAAHERVVYDRLTARREASDPGARQPLLEPLVLELDPVLAMTLEEHRESLARLGLVTEPFGEGAALIREVPAGTGARDVLAEARELLQQLAEERRVQDPFQRAAATVACHSSVRAGMLMAMDEMRRLIEDLERTAAPRTCPHGRPTLIHLGNEAIERQFGRR